jgi:CHAT domain-containing protein
LVVLSACQTGLGDISQGEGVFGLQRGFKKAGANSILMSLWKVDDEATQILMTQFYKNLVSGQSKRQSLRSAQKYLREYNRGQFDKPEYWAAFILLDGIEKNQGNHK